MTTCPVLVDGSPCGEPIEGSIQLYLDYDGGWVIDGIGDDHASIYCPNSHDETDIWKADEKLARRLGREMTAYAEKIAPGGTWQASDPRGGLEDPGPNPVDALDHIAHALASTDMCCELERLAHIREIIESTGRMA